MSIPFAVAGGQSLQFDVLHRPCVWTKAGLCTTSYSREAEHNDKSEETSSNETVLRLTGPTLHGLATPRTQQGEKKAVGKWDRCRIQYRLAAAVR